jgi:heme oxygenase
MDISSFQKNLKEQTSNLHTQAENHPVMQSFVKGTFKKEHLLRFLINVKPCYDVVEQRMLQPYICKMPELKRTQEIQKDIDLLSKDVEPSQLGDLLTPLECTDLWLGWCWSKPVEMLKSELYVRWLADLYGGRIMARGMGVYVNTVTFNEPKQVIGCVRALLDTPNMVVTEDDIIEDTLLFFDYHLDLFKAIQNE